MDVGRTSLTKCKHEDAGMMQQGKEWREEKLVLNVEHEHYGTRRRTLIKAE
jgi:hypothetical protein